MKIMKLPTLKTWKLETILLFSFITLFTLVFTALGWQKLAADLYNGLDLAIFNTSLYNLIHSGLPLNSIHPPSYFSDHLSPILYPLSPLYNLWPGPKLLIALQVFLIALCAWPLFLLIRKRCTSTWGLIVAVAWLTNPWIQWWSLYEFSLLPFLVFFIFWWLLAYEKKNLWAYYSWLILVLSVREEAAIIVAPILLIMLWQKREIKKWFIPTLFMLITSLVISYLFLWSTHHYKFFATLTASSFHNEITTLIVFLVLLLLPLGYFFYKQPIYLLFLPAPLLAFLLNKTGVSVTTLKSHYVALLLWPLFAALGRESKVYIPHTLIPRLLLLPALTLITMIIWGPLFQWPIPTAQEKLALQENRTSHVVASYSPLTRLSTRSDIQSFNYAYWGKGQYNLTNYVLHPQTDYIVINWKDLLMARGIWQENYNQGHYDKHLTDNLHLLMSDFQPFAQSGNTTFFRRGKDIDWIPRQMSKNKNELGFNSVKFIAYNNLPAILVTATVPPSTDPYILRLKIGSAEQMMELGSGFFLPTSTAQTISQTIFLNSTSSNIISLDISRWSKPSFALDAHNSANLLWPLDTILYTTTTSPDTSASDQ